MNLPSLNKLRIVHYPDPVLREVSKPVEEFGPDLKALAERMLTLMREGEEAGAGLAAVQVGIPVRLFVCNVTGEPTDDLICVNPRFIELTGAEEKEEGCLSIPGVTVMMRRAIQAVIEAQDLDGKPLQQTGVDLMARVWQHEMDHIEARLIIDQMSATDEIANRRAIKQLKAAYASRRHKRSTRCA